MSNDLNLLRVFGVILEENNLSRAAKRLHLTQPALSRSLSKLRDDFGDQLFIRAPGGMLPTARALELEPILRETLAKAEALYKPADKFDPKTATGTIRLATTDFFEQVIWVDVVAELSKAAPKLTFVTQMTGGELPMDELRDGKIQLAIAGYFKDLSPSLMSQNIFSDHFMAVTRKNHPEIKGKLTLEKYLNLGHVMISPRGDLSGAVDAALQKSSKSRHIAACVASFLSSGPLVAQSDLILTAPSMLIDMFSKYLSVEIYEPPLSLPKIKVLQIWHERYHRDPMLTWIRNFIAEKCRQKALH